MTPSKRLRTSATISASCAGERAAVGVAEAEHVGAGVLGGFERPQGVIGVGVVAVEEVLGVVDHFLAVLLQVPHGVGDQLEVLFER